MLFYLTTKLSKKLHQKTVIGLRYFIIFLAAIGRDTSGKELQRISTIQSNLAGSLYNPLQMTYIKLENLRVFLSVI